MLQDRLSRVVWCFALLLVAAAACTDVSVAYGAPVLEPRTPGQVVALVLVALLVTAALAVFIRRGE